MKKADKIRRELCRFIEKFRDYPEMSGVGLDGFRHRRQLSSVSLSTGFISSSGHTYSEIEITDPRWKDMLAEEEPLPSSLRREEVALDFALAICSKAVDPSTVTRQAYELADNFLRGAENCNEQA